MQVRIYSGTFRL